MSDSFDQKLGLDQTKRYLDRLGLEISAPTKHFLFALHREHVSRIPWQTVDIFAGKPTSIDPKHSVPHIASGGSGYCFHLNGAFSSLLQTLGYRVFLHRAGVQARGTEPRVDSFHLGLSVMLPDKEGKDQRWLVDVGLGDMPYEPLPIAAGHYHQSPHTYKISDSKVVEQGWRLDHDPYASFPGVDVEEAEVQGIDYFIPKHEYLSTSPDSVWVNLLLVRNRQEQGSRELRGCIFSQRDPLGIEKREVTSRTEWFDLLAEVFGVKLEQYDRTEKDELWSKVIKKHAEWKRSVRV
ncbi:arylamine N-acetyltransferase family protein [Paenibacillus turpanensis]|uniref:arylamine N-acetyltransferase family protein n=1 Tax=Paenibacillus turpanensis TaxID=2689078 RepID=UPI00140CFA16|nr:arylamine N-acetyltransferase [Paenibacillus turpanensis]